MKVLHYIPSLDHVSGGTTAYMQLLAGELGKLVDLHVATHKSDNSVALQNCTLHIIRGSVNSLCMQRRWLRLLDELQPDIVHVNCCWMLGCASAVLSSKQRGYKVVLTTHGMLEPWIIKRHYWTKKLPALLLYQRRVVRRADCVHATAESERQNLLKLGYNTNIQVVANGIDVSNIAIKQSWTRRREILFLSRIHVKKGIDYLLEAVAHLRDELNGYTIRIAGEGDIAYINQLRQQVDDLKIADIVHFEGGVYGERKWELFRRADVFVLPTHSENFGIVVAEALACGTPVITTVGTPWQELEELHCGRCIKIGTEPLVQALRDFLTLDIGDIEAMGRRGRKLIEEKYSSYSVAQSVVDMYRSLAMRL